METLKKALILLVEDDLGDQKLIKKSFMTQKLCNDLKITNSGEEALAYLNGCKSSERQAMMPDLILLDLNMPGISGKEFLGKVKDDPELCMIPVVILTTSDEEEDILDSYTLQAAGYIKKPIEFEDFKNAMSGLNDYWFALCKRVNHDADYQKCSVGN